MVIFDVELYDAEEVPVFVDVIVLVPEPDEDEDFVFKGDLELVGDDVDVLDELELDEPVFVEVIVLVVDVEPVVVLLINALVVCIGDDDDVLLSIEDFVTNDDLIDVRDRYDDGDGKFVKTPVFVDIDVLVDVFDGIDDNVGCISKKFNFLLTLKFNDNKINNNFNIVIINIGKEINYLNIYFLIINITSIQDNIDEK